MRRCALKREAIELDLNEVLGHAAMNAILGMLHLLWEFTGPCVRLPYPCTNTHRFPRDNLSLGPFAESVPDR